MYRHREAGEREYGFLDRDVRTRRSLRLAAISAECCFEAFACHDAGCDLGNRRTDCLGDERNRTRSARIDFEDEDFTVLDGELHVHQATDIERLGECRRLAFEFGDDLRRERVDRQRAGAIARMDAGFLDMLHDASDEAFPAIAQAVHVHFDCLGQIGIEKKRILAEQRVDLAGLVVRVLGLDVFRHQFRHRVEQIVLQAPLVMDDLHGAATQNVGRTHDQREAEIGCDQARLFDRIGDAVLWLIEVELDEKLLEAVAVFGKVDGVRRSAEDRNACLFQCIGELERGLAAKLHDHTVERAFSCSMRRISITSSAVSGSK